MIPTFILPLVLPTFPSQPSSVFVSHHRPKSPCTCHRRVTPVNLLNPFNPSPQQINPAAPTSGNSIPPPPSSHPKHFRHSNDPQCLHHGPPSGRGNANSGGNGSNPDDSFHSFEPSHQLSLPAALVAKRRDTYAQTPTPLPHFLQNLSISHILLALNVIIFAMQALYAPALLMSGAKVNSAIAAGEYYRLLSPIFLHASITHLLVNSFSLHSTGPSVESWFGKPRFLALYLMSGISGNILSYLCSPVPAVGASGAIFGLVGASVVLLSRHHHILGPRAKKGLQSLAYVVLLNFAMGLAPGSRIDNFGHLGGFLGGISYSYLLGPRLVVKRTRTGRSVLHDEPILAVALMEMRARLRSLRKMLTGQ